MKKRVLLGGLLALSIMGCSTPMINTSQDFSDLEKEYKSFSTKALSNAYVKRMFNKFLAPGTANPTQVIRQLEFARYLKDIKTPSDTSYFDSLRTIINDDTSIYNKITGMTAVAQYKTDNSLFGYFLDSLNPFQSSVAPEGFKLVAKGTFQMGMTGIAGPVHSVTFTKDLYMGEKEVTQGEWKSVYNATTTTLALKTLMHNTDDPSAFPSGGFNADLPVENINWYGTIAFCNAKSLAENLPVAYDTTTGQLLDASGNVTTDPTQVKGYRLPTGAEWEYAARGGKDYYTNGNLYPGSNIVGNVAWYYSNSDNTTHPVGTKLPNELGLYDMSGNVHEWTTDYYNVYSSDPVTNPYFYVIPSGYRECRGGSWKVNAESVYSALRNDTPTDWRNERLGFRLARTAP